jgi:hypothetical protein
VSENFCTGRFNIKSFIGFRGELKRKTRAMKESWFKLRDSQESSMIMNGNSWQMKMTPRLPPLIYNEFSKFQTIIVEIEWL